MAGLLDPIGAPMMSSAERKPGEWPAWVDELLQFGPIDELETEWRTMIGDAIVEVLDLRAGGARLTVCPCCGIPRATART